MAPQGNAKYRIINAKSGTVLDLSGTNQTTISGRENNGGNNQEWYIEAEHFNLDLVAIKNVRYGKFVNVTGAVHPGAPAVGEEEARLWIVLEVGPELYSIFVPESPFVLELSKDGDKANGTPVVIALEEGKEAQKWKFVEV